MPDRLSDLSEPQLDRMDPVLDGPALPELVEEPE
jgi:hypothetical protein